MSTASDPPDGRPSDLYEVKGRGGWMGQILVDRKTQIIYCSIAPVMSLKGWTLEALRTWIADKDGWALIHLGDGTKVTQLVST